MDDTSSVAKLATPTGHDDDSGYHPGVDVSAIDEKNLMWKVDLHVLPWLTILYLFSFLDRGSIGNAKVCPSINS
jgi:hypothetical protein